VAQHVTVDLRGEPSDIPGRGWLDTKIELEVRDGAVICTELRIVAKPGDRPIRTADLSVFNLDRLAELAFGTTSIGPDAGEVDLTGIRHAVDESYREPLEELRAVARTYLDPRARSKPTQAVMDVLGYRSRATASRRIVAARTQGFIPATGATDADLDAAWVELTRPSPEPYSANDLRRLAYAQGVGNVDAVRAEIEAERAQREAQNVEAD